jgi:hypothetical protein
MSISDMPGDSTRTPGRRSRRFLKRRRTWAVLAVVSAAVLAMGIAIPAARAVHDTGAFELDGNASSSTTTATAPDDWDRVCHQVTGSDCSTTFNTNGATAVDWVSEPNVNSTIFTGGGSKDPNNINQWAFNDNSGGLPAKDNLLHSFAARYSLPSTGTNTGTCPSGTATKCEVLYFGSDRLDNSGDAQQGFWFFQNEITLNTTNQTFNGLHMNGDLLVLSDFSIGGTVSTISVYVWDSTCTSGVNNPQPGQCGATNLRLKATSSAANCASAATGDQFCGLVNANTITMPWSFTDKSGTPNNQALNGEFYEGGVNLSTLGLADRCFQSVSSETRASTSPTATLKDFILGKFGGCTTQVTTHESTGGSTSIGTGSASVSDQATVTVAGVNTWTGTLQFSLQGPIGTALETTQNIGGPITVTNATTQPVQSATATVTAVGNYCWHAAFTSGTNGVPNGTDDGTNECFTVTPVTPTLATSAGPTVTLGNPISDTATLTGTANEPGTPAINPTTAGGPAGGTITFTAFGPNNCTTVAFTTTRTVSGDGTYGPVSFTPTAVGTYHWAATYTGDPPNTNGTSHNTGCTDAGEDVTVTDTTAATSAQTWLPNDTGSVASAGGAPLNGTLSIQLYTGATCASGSEVSGQLYTKTLTNAASPQSLTTTNTTFSVTTTSSVSWKVTFTSSDPNVAGSSHCESTSLTITN